MVNAREQKGFALSTMEQLLSKAISVSIVYATDVREHFGKKEWFELTGDGISELTELVDRFGEQGIAAFNKAFLNSDYKTSVLSEMGRLAKGMDHDGEQERCERDREINALRKMLDDIGTGKEVPVLVLLGYDDSGRFGGSSARDPISIKLKKI